MKQLALSHPASIRQCSEDLKKNTAFLKEVVEQTPLAIPHILTFNSDLEMMKLAVKEDSGFIQYADKMKNEDYKVLLDIVIDKINHINNKDEQDRAMNDVWFILPDEKADEAKESIFLLKSDALREDYIGRLEALTKDLNQPKDDYESLRAGISETLSKVETELIGLQIKINSGPDTSGDTSSDDLTDDDFVLLELESDKRKAALDQYAKETIVKQREKLSHLHVQLTEIGDYEGESKLEPKIKRCIKELDAIAEPYEKHLKTTLICIKTEIETLSNDFNLLEAPEDMVCPDKNGNEITPQSIRTRAFELSNKLNQLELQLDKKVCKAGDEIEKGIEEGKRNINRLIIDSYKQEKPSVDETLPTPQNPSINS